MATKRGFNAGADYDKTSTSEEAEKVTYHCRAHHCPLTGAFEGHCSHHWWGNTHDWARITKKMHEHRSLVSEILRAKRLFADMASNPRTVISGHVDAQARLWPNLTEAQREFLMAKPIRSYHGWVYRLETMLTDVIYQEVKRHRDESNLEHPANAHRVRAAQIPGQAADFLASEEMGI